MQYAEQIFAAVLRNIHKLVSESNPGMVMDYNRVAIQRSGQTLGERSDHRLRLNRRLERGQRLSLRHSKIVNSLVTAYIPTLGWFSFTPFLKIKVVNVSASSPTPGCRYNHAGEVKITFLPGAFIVHRSRTPRPFP
jgi:hypothetical protein